MSRPLSPLGVRLVAARAERGWTQRQAADVMGVSQNAVNLWEHGSIPNRSHLKRLARFLGIDLHEAMVLVVGERQPSVKLYVPDDLTAEEVARVQGYIDGIVESRHHPSTNLATDQRWSPNG